MEAMGGLDLVGFNLVCLGSLRRSHEPKKKKTGQSDAHHHCYDFARSHLLLENDKPGKEKL